MRFIQSTNEENVLINLEHVITIQNCKEGLCFNTVTEDIIWELTLEQFEEDWKNILSHLNNDINQKEII